jgi:hypothetical protein
VLHFSNDDASGFLVEALVAPMVIEFDEEISDAVVLTHPNLIHIR